MNDHTWIKYAIPNDKLKQMASNQDYGPIIDVKIMHMGEPPNAIFFKATTTIEVLTEEEIKNLPSVISGKID